MLLLVVLEIAVHVPEPSQKCGSKTLQYRTLILRGGRQPLALMAVQEPGSYGPGMCGLVRPSRGQSDDNAIGLLWDKDLYLLTVGCEVEVGSEAPCSMKRQDREQLCGTIRLDVAAGFYPDHIAKGKTLFLQRLGTVAMHKPLPIRCAETLNNQTLQVTLGISLSIPS
jgi:hypothetical protein